MMLCLWLTNKLQMFFLCLHLCFFIYCSHDERLYHLKREERIRREREREREREIIILNLIRDETIKSGGEKEPFLVSQNFLNKNL